MINKINLQIGNITEAVYVFRFRKMKARVSLFPVSMYYIWAAIWSEESKEDSKTVCWHLRTKLQLVWFWLKFKASIAFHICMLWFSSSDAELKEAAILIPKVIHPQCGINMHHSDAWLVKGKFAPNLKENKQSYHSKSQPPWTPLKTLNGSFIF